VLGALLAQDLALFVAFFDLMLIPFFFLTGIWGDSETRVPPSRSSSSTRWSARC
jgi:NADH-quinone oxidoreductase subunit M